MLSRNIKSISKLLGYVLMYGVFLTLLPTFWRCGNPNATEHIVLRDDSTRIVREYDVLKGTKVKHGKLTVKDFDGKMYEESNFDHGKLSGVQKLYTKGKLYSIAHFKDSIIHGLYTSYHIETGEPYVIGNYNMGVMEGKWKTYTNQGKLKEIVTFKNNEENGPFVEFWPNGKIKAEGEYLNGDNENGLLYLYSPNGVLYKKMECKEGNCHTIWEKGKEEKKGL